jgi:hypothetical protein
VSAVPNTDYAQMVAAMNERARQGGLIFFLFTLFSTFYLLFVITYTIGVVVLHIQALVVGVPTYNQLLPANNTEGYPVDCQYTVGLWLVIYGAVGLVTWIHSFCLGVKYDRKRWRLNTLLTQIAAAFVFGWVCYGVHIWAHPEQYPYANCSPSQYSVFEIVVLFDFFGTIIYFISSYAMVRFAAYYVRPINNPGAANNNVVVMQDQHVDHVQAAEENHANGQNV